MDTQQETTNIAEKTPGIFRVSYLLAKKSLLLVRQDSRLIIFPILSCLVIALFLAVFFIARVLVFGGGGPMSPSTLIFLLFVLFFVSTISTLGVIFSLHFRLFGHPISPKEAFNAAFKKTDLIFTWSLLSSVVVALIIISPFGKYSLLVKSLFGIYWGLATYFIAPAILKEESRGLSRALARSVDALKREWREMVIINLFFVFLLSIVVNPLSALLDIFLFAGPLFVVVSPIHTGVVFLCAIFLRFFIMLLMIFAILYQTAYTYILYIHRLGGDTEKDEKERASPKKPIKRKLIQTS